jgi:hypothetical protein
MPDPIQQPTDRVLVAIGSNGEGVTLTISPGEWITDRQHMLSIIAHRIDQEMQRAGEALRAAQFKAGPKGVLP